MRGRKEAMVRKKRRRRILDIVPLFKNGDRLVIYTATDATSALKISRPGVPAPDGFLYFSRLVFSLPSLYLSSSLVASFSPCNFLYALIYPSRSALRPTVSLFLSLSSISRDFSPIFCPCFFFFPQKGSLLYQISVSPGSLQAPWRAATFVSDGLSRQAIA